MTDKYRREHCPICQVTCEQRQRTLWRNGETRQVRECVECEAIYLVNEQVELPDGWRVDANATHMPEAYVHTSGARVQRFVSHTAACWSWYPATAAYGSKCHSPADSMRIAMAAALAATLSAAEQHAQLEREYGCTTCRIASPRECAESGHLSCDALKVEEESARGEP
jgi:hypothetical protein